MKKYIKSLLVLLTIILAPLCVHADLLEDCMNNISDNKAFTEAMVKIFPKESDLNKTNVANQKNKILAAIGGTLLAQQNECVKNLATLAKASTGKVKYVRDNKKYAFQFKMSDLFDLLNIPVGIMVYNNLTKTPGDIIKLSDIPKLYWSDECSDHTIWDNLDDDAGVNIAGQKVFSKYGGSDNEFFLDFEEGNNRRAFPGLVLMDKTGSTAEQIVQFTNLNSAIDAAQKFATALESTKCSQDGLGVYIVSLNTQKLGDNGKDGWGIAAGVVGGSMAILGIGYGLSTVSIVAATGSMALVNATLATAAAASSIPVAGWVVAGVAVAAAGIISLVPGDIADIKQVMILDGPYKIK